MILLTTTTSRADALAKEDVVIIKDGYYFVSDAPIDLPNSRVVIILTLIPAYWEDSEFTYDPADVFTENISRLQETQVVYVYQ